MASKELISSLKTLRLPESVVFAVLGDYLELLKDKAPAGMYDSFRKRLEDDKAFEASAANEVELTMLASTLMMTLESSVDFSAIVTEVFPHPSDIDLQKLRNELVGRTYHMSKDIPSLAGLSKELVKKRMSILCANTDQ